MEHIVQVELRTDSTHTLTWLDAALKPKPGMVLLCKDDERAWTVVHAYSTAQESEINHKDWRLVGCKGQKLPIELGPYLLCQRRCKNPRSAG